MATTDKPRRVPWRALLGLLLVVLVALAAAVAFLPHLLPSSTVARQVETMLSEQLGRRVTVAWARLAWDEGLTARDIRIHRRSGEGFLARADQMTVALGPAEAARAAAGRTMRIDSLRFDGLELWLVVDEDGHLNVADLAQGEPLDIGAIQVGSARLHVENRRTNRELEFENFHASAGQLTSTGNAYVSLSADLCPAPGDGASPLPDPPDGPAAPVVTGTGPCGHLVLTANLERLRLEPGETPVGSVKAEWTGLPWPRVCAAMVPESSLAGLVAETSGRMSAQFGPADAWSAEGAIHGTQVALPATEGRPAMAALPRAILGFRVRCASPRAPLVLDLLKFSTPGLDLKVTGSVELASSANAEAAEGAGAEPAGWAVRNLDLNASGAVSWVPLCQNAEPLRPLLKRFDRLGGKARLGLRVQSTDTGVRVDGSADLSDTVVAAEGFVAKGKHDRLSLRVMAEGNRAFERVSPAVLDLVTDAGQVHLEAAVSVRDLLRAVGAEEVIGPAGAAPPAAGTEATLAVDVRETAALLALVPALRNRLGPLTVQGPCRIDVAMRPMGGPVPGQAAAAPPGKQGLLSATWTAAVRADLTATGLAVPGGANKPTGLPATLDADAIVWPDSRRSDVRNLVLRLGAGRVAWEGAARIDWPRLPDEQPVGRFEGKLALEKMSALGGVVAPGRFGEKPPVSGGAVFAVVADLAKGRLRTRMNAGLQQMDLRLGEYLVKPAGQTASLTMTTLWYPGRWNHVEGEGDLDLPGLRLSALGQATIVAQVQDEAAGGGPPPGDASREAAGAAVPEETPAGRPRSTVTVMLVPKTTLELRASVSDLTRAAAISPLLKTGLEHHQAEGRAEGRVVVAFRQHGPQVTADLDFTETALTVGGLLKKPAGEGLTARVVGDLAPNPKGWVDVNVGTAEVRLGESVVQADGRVRIDPAAFKAPVAPRALLAAALKEADLQVRADWQHGPALRRTLPWLAPLATRCTLEGVTHWTVAVSGTPTKGQVQLDVNATACRVDAGAVRDGAAGPEQVTVKPAGTAAAVRLKVRYGEVPGEMVVDDLAVTVSEATASASGRFLFNDPRLLVLAPPTAWTLQVDGQVPDAAILASLMPWRVANLGPTGAVTIHLRAAADAKGPEVESCRLHFDGARIRWLGRVVRLDGPLAYDYERLETDGLHLQVGGSDVRLVTYISRPTEDPTGSVIVRGTALDLAEVEEMIRQTSESLTPGPEAGAKGEAPPPAAGGLSRRLGDHLRQLLARANLSADVRLDRVVLTVPEWQARYNLEGLEAEGRLSDSRLVMPRFACRLNQGTVTGQMRLDFREDVPVLDVAYDARDLVMDENLDPFIDTTFPGLKVFGTLSTRATRTQRLAEGAYGVGQGETVLTEGVLEGPAAPDYMTRLLPGLKLTRYAFNRMSNVFVNKPNGDTQNRMLFDGKAYNVFIFGVSHPNGETRYTLGVDLLVGLQSDVISRTLDQGKLPLMHYWGRLVGSSFAEREVSYVLPHEFAYDVFIRRNLLLELIRSIGEKEPEIRKPTVLPKEEHRATPG